MSRPPLLINRELEDLVLLRTRSALRQRRLEQNKPRQLIVPWAQRNFYVPDTGNPIVFSPHQRAILKAAFTRGPDGHFPYKLILLSSVKKSGKTCLAAVVSRWIAEEQTRFGEIATTGNDQRQARERVYEQVAASIRLTPGYRNRGSDGYLKERWVVQATKLTCLMTGSKIEALSVDARGEAGANPDLTVWTELWGFENPDAVKFFHEMTPPPTKADSIRLIETYAGFDGESLLLKSQYDLGLAGRQLTAGELAEITGVEIGCFQESSKPDDPVPIWINEGAGLFMYWDSGLQARRMQWQRGEEGARYYAEEEQKLPPPTFHRIHM